VWAQSDSTLTPATAKGDSVLLPAATLSDSAFSTGIAQDDSSAYYPEVQYKAPNRNPIYYFGSPFASHFAELDFLFGADDMGIGLTYAYLPEVWGGHITGLTGFRARWLMVGADYRLSKPWSRFDWQLFTSLGYRHGTLDNSLLSSAGPDHMGFGPAMQLGIRMGRIPYRGSFCLSSASLGVLTDFNQVFVTLGFSTSFALLASTFFLLGFAY